MVSVITLFHVCNLTVKCIGDFKFGINPVDLGNAAAAMSGHGKQEVTGRLSNKKRKKTKFGKRKVKGSPVRQYEYH